MSDFKDEAPPRWVGPNWTRPLPRLRILVVIDGRVQLSKDPGEFGLGYALDALPQMRSIVDVTVGLATREEFIADYMRGGREVLYTAFKFTQDGFDLDSWDQVWLFADQPHNGDGDLDDTDDLIPGPFELTDAEVLRLTQWMDRGGGVFAVGDHSILGASMCHRIPRVRTMRRWTHADNVPEKDGPTRNQTLQPGSNGVEDDLLLQPVELVVFQTIGDSPFNVMQRPHPLMCTRSGPIERFPDHMHEGEVTSEAEVDLHRALDIPGYDRPEYPPGLPFNPPGRGVDLLELRLPRPRPQVIAYGRTTNDAVVPWSSGSGENAPLHPPIFQAARRFGLISVYDGDRAGVGRVACESTWHHWFSYNLDGIVTAANSDFAKMKSYYRNMALWLASPAKRREMTVGAVWTMLLSPAAFTGRRTAWEMGEKATELMHDWMSPCWVNELVNAQFDASVLYLAPNFEDSPNTGPTWGVLPESVVHRAVLGTLCVALRPLANDVARLQRLHNHVELDPRAIHAAADRARAEAPRILEDCLVNAAESYKTLAQRWAVATRPHPKTK